MAGDTNGAVDSEFASWFFYGVCIAQSLVFCVLPAFCSRILFPFPSISFWQCKLTVFDYPVIS